MSSTRFGCFFGFPPGALCAPPPFLFLTGKEPNHKKLEVSCEHERKEGYTRRSILSSSLRNHKRVQSRVKWAECIASPCIKQGKTIHYKQTVCFRFRSLAIGPTSRGFFIASSLQPFRWKGNRILPLILRNDSYFRSSARTVHFFYLVILPTTHPMTTDRKWDFPAAERIYSLCSPHTIFLRCFIGVMHRLNRRTEKKPCRLLSDRTLILSYQKFIAYRKVMSYDLIPVLAELGLFLFNLI